MKRLNILGFGAVRPLLLVFVLVAAGATGFLVFSRQNKQEASKATISNFEECVAAGNPVMESFPEQCRANGTVFTKNYPDSTESTPR